MPVTKAQRAYRWSKTYMKYGTRATKAGLIAHYTADLLWEMSVQATDSYTKTMDDGSHFTINVGKMVRDAITAEVNKCWPARGRVRGR